MEGKRRDREDMQDSLVVEEGMIFIFPLVPFATCLLPLQLLLQGSFQQEEVKQPQWRDTQRPNIMNYVVPSEAPDQICAILHGVLTISSDIRRFEQYRNSTYPTQPDKIN